MLKYFIEVQQTTLALGLLLPLLGLAVQRAGGKAALRRFLIAAALGAVLAAAVALLKTFTGLIVTEYWNLGLVAGVVLSGTLFLLADNRLLPLKRKDVWPLRAATILAGFLVAYVLRADLLFIREFIQADESLFDVIVALRALGWALGLLLVALCGIGTTAIAAKVDERTLRPLRNTIFVVYLVYGVLALVQVLYARYLIPRLSWIRDVLRASINQGDLFLYVFMALCLVVMVCALIAQRRALRAQGAIATQTANPALRRKAKALWRSTRRWATVVSLGFVLVVLSLTVIRAYDEREIVLAPAEPLEYVGSTVQIPLSTIDDGHLHRFAHITDTGTEVRFIIIKKNETAYGVGLDACNVCGATGYYERDNEVVCKMCDVVMNKQTIGFPGGCNPIPLEFTVGEGVLSVEVALLEKEAGRFE